MKTGVFIFPTDYSIDIAELAVALEERGFEALFVPEHTHIPTSRRSPFPAGGPLQKRYAHTHDPFIALSFAAAATEKLTIGTGICLLAQRDPIVTAKVVASLDRLSGGRFIFGLGGGWNVEEMEDHGATYRTRFAIVRERVLAMKKLWTEDEASFSGEHVSFESCWSWPKPVQTPNPPLLMGGETDYTLRRVVDYCDGWLPRPRPGFDPKEQMDRLRAHADAAGRDMSTLQVTLFRAPPDKEKLDACREAGMDRALFEIPDMSRDEALRLLDDYAPLAAS